MAEISGYRAGPGSDGATMDMENPGPIQGPSFHETQRAPVVGARYRQSVLQQRFERQERSVRWCFCPGQRRNSLNNPRLRPWHHSLEQKRVPRPSLMAPVDAPRRGHRAGGISEFD